MKHAVVGLLGLGLLVATSSALAANQADAKKKSGTPSFAREGPQKASLADMTERSILDSIDNQKMIIDLEDPSRPKYAEMVVELADYYWNLADVYFRKVEDDDLEQGIYDAEEAKDTATLARLQKIQDGFQKQREGYQDKTIKTYRDVIQRFPKTPKIDEIRYYLGRHLTEMGRTEEAVAAFTELILKHSDSEFVPDALVNIGDHYFELNKYKDALALYEQVE